MWRLLLLGLLFLPIDVVAQEATPPAFAGLQSHYLETEVDVLTPYIGQEVTYTIRLYSDETQPGTTQLPNFTGFWQGQSLEPRSRAEIFNNRQFIVVEQDIKLYPLHVGSLTIASAAYTSASGETVVSNTQQLTVKPLPSDVPEGYQGAVGQYLDMQAYVESQPISLGEPVTVRLTITGIGNLEQLIAPEMRLPEGWRHYASSPEIRYSPGLVVLGEKTFEWILVPNQAGSQLIPAFVFTYFDPQNEEYRSLETPPIPLEVLPGVGDTNELNSSQTFSPGAELLPLKALDAGSLAGGVYPSLAFWFLWIIAPSSAAGTWLWVYRQQRIQANLLRIRQSRALRHARRQLDDASKHRNQQAYHLITDAIYLYFGEKLNRRAKELSPAELQAIVTQKQIKPDTSEPVLACLSLAEEGRYAPIRPSDVKPLVSRTVEALSKLDSAWKAE